MDTEKLEVILKAHREWLVDTDTGKRLDLRSADLRSANLRDASLQVADLRSANLQVADLRHASLQGANLWNANLRDASLQGANLRSADLRDASLQGANLSQTTGLLNAAAWLKKHFKSDEKGLIVYKAIGHTDFTVPDYWTIKPGSTLEEVVNPCRTANCACGVNFGTRDWIKRNYPSATVWKCRIEWMDLAGVVVPYHTAGKARCARLTLLEKV